MRAISAATLLLLAATLPVAAADDLAFSCEGTFGADTTHQKIVDAFGADNVVFATVPGDEGTYPEATVLFPTDPTKRLSIVWSDSEARTSPNYIYIGEDSLWTVGGLRTGMSIDEVQALNGKPFTLGGFNDIDRGQVQNFDGGRLSLKSGVCDVTISFAYPYFGIPIDLADPLDSEGSYSSEDPTYRALGSRIRSFDLNYD